MSSTLTDVETDEHQQEDIGGKHGSAGDLLIAVGSTSVFQGILRPGLAVILSVVFGTSVHDFDYDTIGAIGHLEA